jgi:hypothetical protein
MRTIQEDFREFAHLDHKRRGDGLSPRELHRWQVLRSRLDGAFGSRPPAGSGERRSSLRVPTRMRVSFAAASGSEDMLTHPEGTVTNLSRTGCFVCTETPAPLGTQLTLVLSLGTREEPIEVGAQVVSGGAGEGGMGLRFCETSPESRKRLDALYEGLEADTPR